MQIPTLKNATKHHPNVSGKIWVLGHGGIWGNVPQGIFIFRGLDMLLPLFSYQQLHKLNMKHACKRRFMTKTLIAPWYDSNF